MKKSILFCLFVSLLIFSVFCENPFSGNWRVEVLNVDNNVFIDCENDVFDIKSKNENMHEKTIIDTQNQTITIPIFASMCDKFRYQINKDGIIDLYVFDKLSPGFQNGFISKNANYPNTVSRDASVILVKSILDGLTKAPLLRFIPYVKTNSLMYNPQLIHGKWTGVDTQGNTITFIFYDNNKADIFQQNQSIIPQLLGDQGYLTYTVDPYHYPTSIQIKFLNADNQELGNMECICNIENDGLMKLKTYGNYSIPNDFSEADGTAPYYLTRVKE
jgi:hypothetical protein